MIREEWFGKGVRAVIIPTDPCPAALPPTALLVVGSSNLLRCLLSAFIFSDASVFYGSSVSKIFVFLRSLLSCGARRFRFVWRFHHFIDIDIDCSGTSFLLHSLKAHHRQVLFLPIFVATSTGDSSWTSSIVHYLRLFFLCLPDEGGGSVGGIGACAKST